MRRRALVAMLAVLLAGAEARAGELRVGARERFATIGAALEAARPGDRVVVGPGEYRERLEVRTGVTLVGQGEPRLIGPGKGAVVRIVAPDVELRGFSVTGSGSDMMRSDAGIRVEGARAKVVGNRVHGNLFGVYLHGCEDARVEDNEITGRAELDVGSRGPGIHLYDSRGATIARNRVSLVRDGVYFDHSDQNLVQGNDFSRLRYAIHYMFCADNRFVGNAMHDSVGGAAIMYTSRVSFEGNRVYRNRDGFNAFGLLLKDCEDSRAARNSIVDNVTGIFLEGAHRNLFEGNLVAHNEVAVMLYASALDNRFTANDFVGNRAVLHRVGRAHAEWAVKGVGNYYDDYPGYDLDGDGRGDVPHRLQDAFEYLAGNHPLLRLQLLSPAADALAVAERSFPVIPRGDEQDPSPAMRPFSRAQQPPPGPRQGTPLLVLAAALTAGAGGAAAWRLRR
ncbi:MAG TPA: nitrous oxide reductase family maturation protein NosD [Myxococcales bacterium]|jgi:nitrous oxidase accessory protein